MSRSRTLRRRTLLAAGALVALTACGDGGDAGEVPDAAGAAVDARNIAFDPDSITVDAGTSITFTNQDTVGHTVTAGTPDDPGDAFDEEISTQGATATITFDDPGEIAYFCRIHPSMRGTVSVQG